MTMTFTSTMTNPLTREMLIKNYKTNEPPRGKHVINYDNRNIPADMPYKLLLWPKFYVRSFKRNKFLISL